ncbi:MAG: hypothetical protein ACQET0_02140 [Pseudomonadota bacterium]
MTAGKHFCLRLSGLFLSAMLVGACSIEPIDEPWVNPEQRELVESELDRDHEQAEKLRDRLAMGQSDR